MPDTVWLVAGIPLGMLLAALQRHPRRALGWVPPALTCLGAVLVWAQVTDHLSPGTSMLIGILLGIVNEAILFAQLDAAANLGTRRLVFLDVARRLGMVVPALVGLNLVVALSLGTAAIWYAVAVVAASALIAWFLLYRETIEQIIEFILWPMYRIRGYGPGLKSCPRCGPLLVVANHSAWMDPLWLGKVLPRRLTPMMTSSFYDLPGLRWLMVYVVHAIRVQDSEYRREAPELDLAVAALDRGECVVIFPEGRLRRSADMLLRQFGQGVWHILSQRPDTEVVTCWIEGGFGSYMSYFGGPPLVNKRMDWWRSIKIAVCEPQKLTAELLADDRSTRTHLMRACLDGRKYLGLPSEPTADAASATAPQNESHRTTV